jgi:hypothetical protein
LTKKDGVPKWPPPDPGIEGPGATAIAAGTNRLDHHQVSPFPSKPTALKNQEKKSGASQTFSVYDGRTPIGRIERDGSCFRATLLPAGKWLGTAFATVNDAADAISAATRGCAHA